jgi:hypothetical protein
VAGQGIGITLQGRGTNPSVDRPEDTLIGGTLTEAQLATPECDGPCNVIAGNSGNGTGIYLGRDGASSSAADGVRIAGNHIGLNAGGFAALPSTFGIEIAEADDVLIGGNGVLDRNLITAHQRAVSTDDRNALDIRVRSNFLGTNYIGDFKLGALTNGPINIRSTASNPATIANNLVAIGAVYGIRVVGGNATVRDNYVGIGPAGTEDIGNEAAATADGIRMYYNPDGFPAATGATISGNRIGNAGRAGIHIEGAYANTIDGNWVGTDGNGHDHPNGRYGVLLDSTAGSAVRLNVIGGGTVASPGNVISNNPAAGIRVAGETATSNTIGQLSGTANGTDAAVGAPGMIDLGPEGPGNGEGGSHSSIRAPQVVLASPTRVVGIADPGSTVRVYQKSGDTPGELSGMVALATADHEGIWTAANSTPASVGQRFVATQTPADIGTSELGNIGTTAAASGPDVAPDTTITGPTLTNDPTPEFQFGSTLAEGAYICRLIDATRDSGGRYVPCPNPLVTEPLPEATGHQLIVKAISSHGLVDATPALHRFDIDLTAPAAPQITGGPEGPTDDTTPTFTFTGETPNELRCSIDGATPQACADGTFTSGPLAPGAHSFAVVQADAAGNVSAPATRSFSVTAPDNDPDADPDRDRTAPQTTITKAPKRKLKLKAGKRRAKVKLAFESSEPRSTFTCSVDGAAAKPCTSPAKLKLRAGKHVIAVAATDAAGNTDRSPAVVRVKVKRAPSL